LDEREDISLDWFVVWHPAQNIYKVIESNIWDACRWVTRFLPFIIKINNIKIID
tara:strand:+ start:4826 stop:4987 length:162 start_codon:yes stop_codon:yes gene_type:complete